MVEWVRFLLLRGRSIFMLFIIRIRLNLPRLMSTLTSWMTGLLVIFVNKLMLNMMLIITLVSFYLLTIALRLHYVVLLWQLKSLFHSNFIVIWNPSIPLLLVFPGRLVESIGPFDRLLVGPLGHASLKIMLNLYIIMSCKCERILKVVDYLLVYECNKAIFAEPKVKPIW